MSSFEAEVKEGLKSMDSKLDELLIWRAGLDGKCEAHRTQTAEVRETLYGNPDGVVKTVNTLWTCKKTASRWRDFWTYVLKIVVAAGIISLAGWLLMVYKVIAVGG